MKSYFANLKTLLDDRRWAMSNRVVLLTGLALVLLSVEGASQQSLPVRVNRWLAVQQTNGSVTYQHQNRLRSAKAGDRLQMVGDAVTTGQRSNTRLEVDTGIGFINVAENTKVTVRLLEFAADNGRITHLDILRGQVRLQLRRFTHRGSRLHIQTPAGVSAVRGTEFGVGVQPTGKTGVATLTGSVDTIAQGQTVAVSGGFQNFTIPGEAPSPPVPLNDNTELRYTLEKQIRAGIRRVRIKGQVDPVNMVFVGEKSQATDRNGQFSVVVPATSHQGLLITVVTPLGRQQTHYLVIKP